MIITTSPTKPLEFTPKGTPRRHVCIANYTDEINALYAAVDTSSQTHLPIPAAWTPASTLDFVRKAVGAVVLVPLSDDEDMFQQGCDR